MNPTLANAAANLKRHSSRRHNPLPTLWLMTDEHRLPNPKSVLATLPRGTGLILRHYGAPDRAVLARELAAACRCRGIILVIAGDWRLAADVGAAGLHLAESLTRQGPPAGARLWQRRSRRLLTVAAHGSCGLRRAAAVGASAALLSPIFPTVSHPKRSPLGVMRAAGMIRRSPLAVIALGGVTRQTVRRLRGSGFAGIAGIGFALA